VNERLYRSSSDRVIAGVAGGIATWLNIDPSLVRIAWVLLAIFSGGLFVLVYFVMMIVVPLAPPGWVPRPRDAGAWTPPPGPGPVDGWAAGREPGAAQDPGAAGGWTTPPPAWPDAAQDPGPAGGWTTPPPAWPEAPQGWSTQRAAERAGLVGGGVLVLLGIWFLVDDYIHIDWSLLWPVVVIAIGVLLIAGAVRRGR
jgi:phage shock protein C